MFTPPDIKKYLFDAFDAAESVEQYTSGLAYSDYVADAMVQAAVERKFEIIGEALSRIRRLDSSLLDNISEHERIIGFRNVIIHGYDAIDVDIVWDAIKNHLPKLKQQIQRLLNE
jgi:uncharacterized protein with HEPN domain